MMGGGKEAAMHITAHQESDVEQLIALIRTEKNAEQRDRLRVVQLAIAGRQTKAIERMTGRSRGFVQRWAYAYRDGGIAAVRPAQRGGSKPKLPPARQQQFVTRFAAGPTEADHGVCTLRGVDGQRILQEEFGVQYSLNGVYNLLHRHGLACLSPRPRHRKQDPEAQSQWLDSAPLLSSRSAGSIPTGRWRSGSRMKPASASRAR